MHGNKLMAPDLWLGVLAPVHAQAALTQPGLDITRHAKRLGT